MDGQFKSLQSRSEQEIAFKSRTEAKNNNYGDTLEEENNGKFTEQKKGKTFSENKRVTLDINDAMKSPSHTRKFLK